MGTLGCSLTHQSFLYMHNPDFVQMAQQSWVVLVETAISLNKYILRQSLLKIQPDVKRRMLQIANSITRDKRDIHYRNICSARKHQIRHGLWTWVTDKSLVALVTKAPKDNFFMERIDFKNRLNELDISNRYDRKVNGACNNGKNAYRRNQLYGIYHHCAILFFFFFRKKETLPQ